MPGITTVSGVRAGAGRAFGGTINVTAVAPNVEPGDQRATGRAAARRRPAELGSDGAFVDSAYASTLHLHVGSPVAVETADRDDAASRDQGDHRASQGRRPLRRRHDLAGAVRRELSRTRRTCSRSSTWPAASRRRTRSELEAALRTYPDAKIQTKSQFISNQEQGLDTLLNLLYVLLSLSIIVSLFGIVNTLVLTVFERTRELGMLRAVGMTRRQVRRMIRHESVITALLGAAFGIPLGVVLALMVGDGDRLSGVHDPVGHARSCS